MRKLTLTAVLAAGLITAAPAFADPQAASASAPAATPAPTGGEPAKLAKDDPNRVVCTREHVVGSNRPQKVCMTVAQREELRFSTQQGMANQRKPVDGHLAPPGM